MEVNVDKGKTMEAPYPGILMYDTRHGGPYDRGAADSYYHRQPRPHYYVGKTQQSERVEAENMTAEEIAAYNQGYQDNEDAGAKKLY
tara:strand:+ start:10637 stop:10897 length:261 start_codon:yes stop_codon:yes gene_type:complete